MTEQFIREDNEVIGVEGERTIKERVFNLGNTDFKILVTETKEKNYYNIYIIDGIFRQEPLNTLKLQEPKEDLKAQDKNFNEETYFNNRYLEIQCIEHYLWVKYGNPSKDEVLSFSVQIESN